MNVPTTAQPRKGNGVPTAPATPTTDPLPEHRQKQIEAGLATYQSVLAERDDLERQLREANMRIEGLNVQLEAIKGVVNMMESSVTTHRLQRDEAITRQAELETTIRNIYAILPLSCHESLALIGIAFFLSGRR